jgi:hypothetical protein
MIVTAIEIQNATKNAVMDPFIMSLAADIYQNKNVFSDEQMAQALFRYSGLLSALTASFVSQVLLSESDLDNMISEINEFENISKNVLGE